MAPYLQHLRMGRYGRYADRVVGPLTPGLNVLYGQNEAGKSSIASFIGSVMFGWPEARGNRNTYKPASGEREGSLIFHDEDGTSLELRRARNADGVLVDDNGILAPHAAALLEDIDKDTFRTMFALDGDELRGLDNPATVASRLLTASSGTQTSPVAARDAIDERIARLTSRAASATESIVNIDAQLEALKDRIEAARSQAEELKAEDAEFAGLTQRREALSRQLRETERGLMALERNRNMLENLISQKQSQLQGRLHLTERLAHEQEMLDGLTAGMHRQDAAQAYAPARKVPTMALALAVLALVGLILIVLPFVVKAASGAMVPLCLGGGALIVLAAVLTVMGELRDRRARDEQRIKRSYALTQGQEASQRVEQIRAQLDQVNAAIDQIEAEHRSVLEDSAPILEGIPGMEPGPEGFTALQVEQGIAALQAKRANLQRQRDDDNERYGQLRQKLGDAMGDSTLDRLRLERAQLRTRRKDSQDQLAKLLLARQMLDAALESWEGESQPAVYRSASRLMALMTQGVWVEVRPQPDGGILAVDATHRVRMPRQLSLGTCQQLYLALRIALLECAPDVGRVIPVLADDILVNFDSQRRKGAIAALAELAEHRQVLLFTCHSEVVTLIQAQVPAAHVVTL